MLSQSKSKSYRHTSQRSRFFLIRFGVVFLFTSLAVRLVYVQGFLRSEMKSRAERQFSDRSKGGPTRGMIMDRNKKIVCETVKINSCFADPSLLRDKKFVAKKLASVFHLNDQVLFERLHNTPGSFLWIKHNASLAAVHKLKQENLAGVGFKTEFRRYYPMGELSPHVLGLVGLDGQGLSGVEQGFESVLGTFDVGKESLKEPRLPAGHLQLTIDASIQKMVEKELSWGIEKTKAKKGFVLVQNPWTGEILAAASWPPVSLNPDNPPQPDNLRIPCLVDVFEPGSTFKIVIAAAALEENLVSEKDVFDGENGKWKVFDIAIRDHEPHGKMTFADIMIHSSNIGTSKVADLIGSMRLYQYARLFGFGVYPGSGVSREAKGVLRRPSQWSGISKYAVSFGQEVGVTAVQLIGAYSAIANGGVLMEPRFVKAIVSGKGDVLWEHHPTEVRRIISKGTADRLIKLLTEAVEKGTGVNAQIKWDLSTKVAGKTGTAQKFNNEKRRYDEDLTLISFCGFFPADNPQFTIAVILDEPEGRRWGGLDAAPVFRRIAEQLAPKTFSRTDNGKKGRSAWKRILRNNAG